MISPVTEKVRASSTSGNGMDPSPVDIAAGRLRRRGDVLCGGMPPLAWTSSRRREETELRRFDRMVLIPETDGSGVACLLSAGDDPETAGFVPPLPAAGARGSPE